MDGLRAAVRASIAATRANDKDRVRVDVVWNQGQLAILVIMLLSRTLVQV